MIDFFTWLFEPMMPRFGCIYENTSLAWWYAIPNIGTWLCYSVGFCYLYYRLRDRLKHIQSFKFLMLVYSIFFFFCGGTHFWNAVSLTWAPYRFFAVWESFQFLSAFFAFFYANQMVNRYAK